MNKKLKTWWSQSKTWHHVLLGLGMVVFLFMFGIFTVRIYHYDKIMPGVTLRGIYVGGLTKPQAVLKLDSASTEYASSEVQYLNKGLPNSFKPNEIGVGFNNAAIVDSAFSLGRDSDIISDIAAQTALPFSREVIMQLNVDIGEFSAAMIGLDKKIAKPSQNAGYSFENGKLEIIPGIAGENIDMGLAILSLTRQISNLQANVDLPINYITPSLSTEELVNQKQAVSAMVQFPIKLKYKDKSWVINQQQLVSWLDIGSNNSPAIEDMINHFYPSPQNLGSFKIDDNEVVNYLSVISKDINQDPLNATLDFANGSVVVTGKSRDGQGLNIEASKKAILDFINSNSGEPINLVVDVKKPEISDDNIASLGIKELIGEGDSFFPGSSPARLQNIKVGAARYQGLVLKPGEVFSFGEILGDVGPAQGYTESKVILDGKQEFQYGGGLCQVSSTIFRAALNAGLPILERTNHAFQVSYYTQPYGVPGVDATIYYPQVDFKFKNDTSKHILVKPEYNGTSLKFRLYGTKEKEGKIRGPYFDFGDLNPNSPSQTKFYRDIIVNGQTTTTDTFTTYYKSALDYPSSN